MKNITFEKATIVISNQLSVLPLRQDREVVVVLNNSISTGLAYLMHEDEKGKSYSVTHIPSGADIGSGYVVDTEEEVREWVVRLLELADWTGMMPRPTMPTLKLLCYASVGAAVRIEG